MRACAIEERVRCTLEISGWKTQLQESEISFFIILIPMIHRGVSISILNVSYIMSHVELSSLCDRISDVKTASEHGIPIYGRLLQAHAHSPKTLLEKYYRRSMYFKPTNNQRLRFTLH